MIGQYSSTRYHWSDNLLQNRRYYLQQNHLDSFLENLHQKCEDFQFLCKNNFVLLAYEQKCFAHQRTLVRTTELYVHKLSFREQN